MKRNTKKPQQSNAAAAESKIRKPGFLKTFVCIFAAVVIVFGATLATVVAIRGASAAASYEGLTMDKKVASYFVSEFKRIYIANAKPDYPMASDSPVFWRSNADCETTHGELLEIGAKEYISQILVANYLFERYSEYTAADKETVEKTISEFVNYRTDGDIDRFNEEVREYGYDYNSFKTAAAMSYKAAKAKRAIYGADGANIKGESELCEEYLSSYTHVYMFLVRTETKDVYDDNGKYVGTSSLTDPEKQQKQAEIEKIREYISATGDIEMSPALFKQEAKRLDEFNKDMQTYGYYFHPNAPYTKGILGSYDAEVLAMAKELKISELLDMSYEMQIGDYSELSTDSGVWFVYKEEVVSGAYSISALEDCFFEFYNDAATYSYLKTLVQLSADAEFGEVFEQIDLISIPLMQWQSPVFSQ